MKKTAKNKRKMLLALVLALAFAGGLYLGALGFEMLGILQPSRMVSVTVTDARVAQVAQMLKQNDVIRSPFLFRTLVWLKGAQNRFFTATFDVDAGDGYNRIINTLTYDSGYRTTDITVPEGSTLKDIAAIVAKTGYVTEKEFTDALLENYEYSFLHGIDRKNRLEGYLFPDTYNISNTMSAREIVSMMLNRFSQVFTQAYSARAKKLGYSDDEILILASIIEGEAGTGNDRSRVSAVFHNRLNKPAVYPYLQSCATVQYILGEKKLILTMEDTRIDSPYNTYRYAGLPIGPICNPGKAAIEAALYPASTDDYYFQSDAQGKIYYAKTMQEHENLKRKIQQ